MLTTGTQLQVRLAGFKSKLDKEGCKRLTIEMSLTETKEAVQDELAQAIEVLQENASLDGLTCDEKMEGVRLEFASPAKPSAVTQIFESTNLSSFVVSRERSQEAGSIEKETSGRITVDFKFSPRVTEGGQWALYNFGDDLLMSIEKMQRELPLESAGDNPDSQESRNELITEAEKEDARLAPKGKAKKGGKKKAKA